LIVHYRQSPDPVFRQDAGSLQNIYDRYLMLLDQQQAMSGPWYKAGFHLLFYHNDDLMAETLAKYSYTVFLSPRAAAWGLAVAFLISFLLELFFVTLYRTIYIAIKGRSKTPATL